MKLEIVPSSRVGPVLLGASAAEVLAALSPSPEAMQGYVRRGELLYFFGSSLQVELDDAGRTQFIGASPYPGCGAEFFLDGRSISGWPASELFAYLAERAGGEHAYDANQYFFEALLVTLYDADEQYDYAQGETPTYGQVGIASEVYRERVRARRGE